MRESFVDCLEHQELPISINDHPFTAFQDLFKIVASEWIVVNTYLKRQLQAIEWNLENATTSIRDLDDYSRSFFMYRRQIMTYINLAREQLDMLKQYGRKAWLPVPGQIPDEVKDIKDDILVDFKYVMTFLDINSERVDKNILLITSLLAVSEGKDARITNRSVVALAGMGIVFLPFSVVSTILSMQGDYGPGQGSFWIFWVVSLLVTICLALWMVWYNGALKSAIVRTRDPREFAERHIR